MAEHSSQASDGAKLDIQFASDAAYRQFDGQSILVTGGTGSFGRQFISAILARSRPRRIAVFSRDEFKQFEMQRLARPEDQAIMRFFIGDVRDVDRLDLRFGAALQPGHAAFARLTRHFRYLRRGRFGLRTTRAPCQEDDEQKDRGKADRRRRKEVADTCFRQWTQQDLPTHRTQEISETNDRRGEEQIPFIRRLKAVRDLAPIETAPKIPKDRERDQYQDDVFKIFTQDRFECRPNPKAPSKT